MNSTSTILTAADFDALYDSAKDALRAFSTDAASFTFAVTAAFGSGVSSRSVADAIGAFDRTGWPRLTITDASTLNGARGAYDSAGDTIYVSRELSASGSAAIMAVLLEEIAHALDARVNTSDAAGDEGAIFAAHVLGSAPDAAALDALKSENDSGTIEVAGQSVSVEFAGEVFGSITLDGNLSDWTAADQIDGALSPSGYDIFARAVGGNYVFALSAPVAIGANTTAWLNTDGNASTGYQIWGFAGGAEYNINFDAAGVPGLYTGDAGQTLVPGAVVNYGYSGDRTKVEFAVTGSVIGSPALINTLWDINNNAFLPTDFSSTQYRVGALPPAPVAGGITLDGSLSDWTAADQIDSTLSASGYDLYGKSTADAYVFAVKAPSLVGGGTTLWLNTDSNSATGHRIWGFAGGAEYNIDFDATGVPRLYTGDAGQTLVSSAAVSYGYSADRSTVEFAIAKAAIGSPTLVNTLWDVNNSTFLPTDFSATQYQVGALPPAPVVGTVTLNGNLSDWTEADQIDSTLSASGYNLYGKLTGGSYVFAIQAPAPVGGGTTVWLNTDQNSSTGYRIWGFAGGAEYNIDFDATGVPRLYTGDAGQTLVPGAVVNYGYSADRTVVEFSISASTIGSPSLLNTLWDVNNNTFLPTDFSATQYHVGTPPPAPVVGSITLDGSLAEWTVANQIDATLSQSGYDLYATATGGSYVFAIKAPTAIGGGTTVWLNTDGSSATGHRIWGFAGGAEYNIDFDATGVPRLYTGDAGQTLVPGAVVSYGYSSDRTVVEFAVSAAAIGGPSLVHTLWDVNNNTFLPTDFSATQYQVGAVAPPPVIGSLTIDGNLNDWTAADAIDTTLSAPGYDLYGQAEGDYFVFAIKAPVAIGANTTVWLNTDENTSTGYQVFGSGGGAEYNINFDADGIPRLFTGAAGQTAVAGANVLYRYSADKSAVEFAVQKSSIGDPLILNTLWDVNNATFLPSNYSGAQYQVLNLPARTDTSQKIGIVYSETTAANYFSPMAYSQLFMAAQNQAAMAGVSYEVLIEADLTDFSKLANLDALVFPLFSHVQSGQVAAIEKALKLAVAEYGLDIVAAGEFMTNDQSGAALAGDSYARMKSLLGLQLVTGGFPGDVTLSATDTAHPMMQDYASGELIRSYDNVGWLAFSPVAGVTGNTLATQNIGSQSYGSVITTTTGGGKNVHFSTEAIFADNNLLWQAIDYAVNGGGVSAGIQLSRNTSIMASRVDMDQAMETFDVDPDNGPGIYDKMLPIVEAWKAQYNYVASYYVDIGDQPPDQATDWSLSGDYYRRLLALGNELGSHSMSHPHFTDALTPAQLQYEFGVSKQVIEQQMSAILGRPFSVDGAAVPGAPENLATALEILKYYDYLSGGFSSVGAGYPGAFGYITPGMAAADKLYFAPNVSFDFSLVEFQGLTPQQAAAKWQGEIATLKSHAEVPILLWPWHDYGAAAWATSPPAQSPYTTEMFTNFIADAYNAGSEFITLADLAQRFTAFSNTQLTSSVSGNSITTSVVSTDAGRFALDLDNIGSQQIARVANWYAYDNDSVFLPRNGGTFTIELGATADDVTRIVSLPMRSELVTVTGNGTSLSFTAVGEGDLVVDLRNSATPYVVTGATVDGVSGERATLDLGLNGTHQVTVNQLAAGASTAGVQTVLANVTHTLTDGYENLTLFGSAAAQGTGNALSNILVGNSAGNVLTGSGGADTLTGGGGADRFDYNALTDGGDTITDFTRGAGGDVLDIRDVLVGFSSGSSVLSSFVRASGTSSATISVNADGAGTDFVTMATLQNVANSANLLNELLANGNLVVA